MSAEAAEGFLRNRSGSSGPFCLTVNFLQPHDVCEWIRINAVVPSNPRYENLDLPPLPDNFEYDDREPQDTIDNRNGDEPATNNWTKSHWRYYIWSYYRIVEQVDAEIGVVLRALEESDHADNTLVVFTSDHGEGMAEHQLTTKQFCYDSAAKVPLIIWWPGHIAHKVDTTHLVSGIDIVPTILDYLDIDIPNNIDGRSLRPILEGNNPSWRDFVVMEARGNLGRMVRSKNYKYITFDPDDGDDQLFDMKNDPGETVNLIYKSSYSDIKNQHKDYLRDWESNLNVQKDVPTDDAWWYS